MSFTQDTQKQVGPQEMNPTNKFDKSMKDPIPSIIGDIKIPKSPKEKMKDLKVFKHLPQIRQEYLLNLPDEKLPF